MSADAAREQVDRHEASLSTEQRRQLGAHYTPEALAHRIVELGWRGLGREPRLTCDPSCGAGAVLLAAADRLAAAGVAPAEVVQERLLGVEVDPAAAAAAREVLGAWALARGAPGAVVPNVVVADSLFDPPRRWARSALSRLDLVCGNPPFLGQLSRDTAFDEVARGRLLERWPELGAYTDSAALHLLVAVEALGDDGAVALLQPQSVLGSRDASPVRSAVVGRSALVGLWASGEQLFGGAGVNVCIPVIRVGAAPSGRSPRTVELQWEDEPPRRANQPDDPSRWAALLAEMSGVPPSTPRVATTPIGTMARLTAGFRDEFYALAAAASEGPGGGLPLVSVGMIDPARLRWGERPRRVGGRRLSHPVIHLGRLELADARVASWVRRRLVPKVLVATQTRVLEAVADPQGTCVPLTPVISVEPASEHTAEGAPTLELLAAALNAPCLSTALACRVAGTGLASGVLRPSAKVLAELPVPDGEEPRRALCEAWRELLASQECCEPAPASAWLDFGRRSDEAYGLSEPAVLEWWWRRHPVARTAKASTGGL